MPTVRTYLVSFSPAEKTDCGFSTTLSLLLGSENHEISASSLPDLEREVRRLAREFGQSCTPYIRLKNRGERSPNGFDKWAYSRSIRFIEFVPLAA
jgi:hypothetical protein